MAPHPGPTYPAGMIRSTVLAVLGVTLIGVAPAHADEPAITDQPLERSGQDPQVALAAEVGAAGGGGHTPGGLRVGGRYLYRLADRDWFDGGVAFTFGQPGAGCGRVPPDAMRCDHGVTDGFAGDLSLGVRRELPGQDGFAPFVRGGGFARVLRFDQDDVSGAALGLELGGGVAAAVGHDVRVVGAFSAFAGTAWLGNGVGSAGQLGMFVTMGAEMLLP